MSFTFRLGVKITAMFRTQCYRHCASYNIASDHGGYGNHVKAKEKFKLRKKKKKMVLIVY